MAQLLRNPTAIGDIFFSGSQTVVKGEAVTWILDDTWAFKATEDCAVSTNRTPFVNIVAGQTFLIYKRTEDDIADKNGKGIYVFDRDTVVALAYPQDVTQDIIIENEIYNDNRIDIINQNKIQNDINNNISIDTIADVIVNAGADKQTKVGVAVTLVGTYDIKAGETVASVEWHRNGIRLSTSTSVTYTPTALGDSELFFTVTTGTGFKGQDRVIVRGVDNEAPIAKAPSNKTMVLGESLALVGDGVDSDGTIVAYKWLEGASTLSNSQAFTYRPTSAGFKYLTLQVTDNSGSIGADTMTVTVNAPPPIADLILSNTFNAVFQTRPSWLRLGTITSTQSATGSIELKASVPLWSMNSTQNSTSHTVTVRVLKGTTELARWTLTIPKSNTSYIVGGIKNYSGGINSGEQLHLEIYDAQGQLNKNNIKSNNGNQQLSFKVSNRTS